MLSLFGASFRVVLLPPITTVLAQNTVNSPLSELSHSELVEVAQMGRAYVAGDRGAVLPEGSDEKVAFTPDVVSHMEDVRSVIFGALIVTLACVVLLIVCLVYAGRKAGKRTISFGLFFGGITAVVLALALSLIGYFNFDGLFTAMHTLLFANGTWTFAEDSLLICAYPLSFWVGMALVWAVALVLLSTIVSIIGFALRREKRYRSKRDVKKKRSNRS